MVEPLALTAWHLFSAFLYRCGIVFVDMLTCILVLFVAVPVVPVLGCRPGNCGETMTRRRCLNIMRWEWGD